MKVTDKDVAYVADLANLDLTEEERGRMLRDLNSILEYIERLGELDTGKVAPMAQVSDRYGVDESRHGSERLRLRDSRGREGRPAQIPAASGRLGKCSRHGRDIFRSSQGD